MDVQWPVSYAEDSRCSAYDGLTEQEIGVYEEIAAELLWNWTARAFGTVPVTVRPCLGLRRTSTFWGWRAGELVAWSCGACGSPCRCSQGTILFRLPSHATSVENVVVDGTDLTGYRLTPDGWDLIRTDGGVWPRGQDLSLDTTEPGTWAISYTAGRVVPLGGQRAAGTLACELAKMSLGDSSCQLPRRFQAITRQGVTVAALDTFEDLAEGHTGIWSVDAWVASVTKAPQRSVVWSPDVARAR